MRKSSVSLPQQNMESKLSRAAVNVDDVELAVVVDIGGSKFGDICAGGDDGRILEGDCLERNTRQ